MFIKIYRLLKQNKNEIQQNSLKTKSNTNIKIIF